MTSRHGSPVRGLSNVPRSSIRDQRFGRLFRDLPPASFGDTDADAAKALTALGQSMIQPQDPPDEFGALDKVLGAADDDENPDIPAGYTYFGQFVDHDITFDPASSLDRFNDPDALQDFRTPRLDLDSVYGSGPDDQPFLYDEDGAHMLLGVPKRGGSGGFDLPRNRNADGLARRALIGDKRNDENVIVSQLQSTFLRFHNRVLDHLPGDRPLSERFLVAQQTVRWHYQWIVLHDFLPRIVGQETHEAIFKDFPSKPIHLDLYNPGGRYAFIPVEFSVAAYRYGHSQVRPSYALNNPVGSSLPGAPRPTQLDNAGNSAPFFRVPIFSAADSLSAAGATPEEKRQLDLANLNGFRELPDFWSVDWGFFLDGVLPLNPTANSKLPQHSYKIDTQLVNPLQNLPDHQNQVPDLRSLPVLNLLRGWRMDLPSGQSVAHFLGLEALTDEILFSHEDGALDALRKRVLTENPGLAGNAPLWFYILKEAEHLAGGKHLGPVGGKIVAEVLTGLVLADGQSFVSQWPTWTPTLPSATPGSFTLSDLVNYAIGAPPRPVVAAVVPPAGGG